MGSEIQCLYCDNVLKHKKAVLKINPDGSKVLLVNVDSLNCDECSEIYMSSEQMDDLLKKLKEPT